MWRNAGTPGSRARPPAGCVCFAGFAQHAGLVPGTVLVACVGRGGKTFGSSRRSHGISSFSGGNR